MILHVSLLLSFISTSESSILCYVTTKPGNYSTNQWTEEKVSCRNTQVCVTRIDYGKDTIKKECGFELINCTFNGVTMSPICKNSSISSLAECCCYGELCNRTSSIHFPFLILIFFLCFMSREF